MSTKATAYIEIVYTIWLNELLPIFAYIHNTHLYIFNWLYILFAICPYIQFFHFRLLVCLLASLFSLFTFYRSIHNEYKPLLFAICFFLFPASFTISSRCGSTHKWLQCIKVSKVKVWSCHDTTRKYNEWGKWHISARNAHALTHE